MNSDNSRTRIESIDQPAADTEVTRSDRGTERVRNEKKTDIRRRPLLKLLGVSTILLGAGKASAYDTGYGAGEYGAGPYGGDDEESDSRQEHNDNVRKWLEDGGSDDDTSDDGDGDESDDDTSDDGDGDDDESDDDSGSRQRENESVREWLNDDE